MRWSFWLGRRMPEFDFFLCVRGKKEQFRARNNIVESSLRVGCDYTFMLDDDQIIDIDNTMPPTARYDFLRKLVKHMEDDPTRGIVGALYYQRDNQDCWPVIMQAKGEGYFFLTHAEISGQLQKVDVTGGGAMLINNKVFDRVLIHAFEPEFEYGTDIQICKKVAQEGFSVWCDTSIELGHTRMEKEIVTSRSIARLKK